MILLFWSCDVDVSDNEAAGKDLIELVFSLTQGVGKNTVVELQLRLGNLRINQLTTNEHIQIHINPIN